MVSHPAMLRRPPSPTAELSGSRSQGRTDMSGDGTDGRGPSPKSTVSERVRLVTQTQDGFVSDVPWQADQQCDPPATGAQTGGGLINPRSARRVQPGSGLEPPEDAEPSPADPEDVSPPSPLR